jgi:alpha-beta hydrolase superfamily lysophospholipase
MSAAAVAVLTEGEFASSSVHAMCCTRIVGVRRRRRGVTVRAVAFLALGLFDHAGRYAEFAERLVARGLAVYAMDMVGHGRSGGSRGQIDDWQVVAGDLHAFSCARWLKAIAIACLMSLLQKLWAA